MKIKSIDKLERITDAATVRLSALVTYTDGVKDVQVQVNGEPINPTNRTKEEVETFIKTSLQTAITARALALDVQVVEEAKLDTLKTTILSDLSKAGLTVLLALMLWLAPMFSWAGDLTPSWTAYQVGHAGVSVTAAGQPGSQTLATIDMSGYYVCEVTVAWEETGDNPAGNAGVSVFFGSAVTGFVPNLAFEISTSDYANNFVRNANTGVSKVFVIESIPQFSVTAGKSAVDSDTFRMFYRLMKGAYN